MVYKNIEDKRACWRRHYKRQVVLSGKNYRKNPAGKKSIERRRKLRLECIEYYSKGTNKCACCGEKHIEFLAIDHIGGGGSKHRKEVRKRYSSMYAFLKAKGFPKGYRILCHNCNLSLGFYGYCPHSVVKNTE